MLVLYRNCDTVQDESRPWLQIEIDSALNNQCGSVTQTPGATRRNISQPLPIVCQLMEHLKSALALDRVSNKHANSPKTQLGNGSAKANVFILFDG